MTTAPPPPPEVVLIGASNVTRLLPVYAATLRATFGAVRMFVAHGHGRSYGIDTRFFGRRLDGHVDSALWEDLREHGNPAAARYALVTDVGNDLIYGRSVPEILSWVGDCVARLKGMGFETTITSLPVGPVLSLSPARFRATAKLFFPPFDVSHEDVVRSVRELDAGVRALAEREGLGLAEERPEWFFIDPIHVRYRFRLEAVKEYLGRWPSAPPIRSDRSGWREAVRLWRTPPKRKWVKDRCLTAEQPAKRVGDCELWLY